MFVQNHPGRLHAEYKYTVNTKKQKQKNPKHSDLGKAL